MESALTHLGNWILSPLSPAFAIIYLGLFGVQIGKFQIHGIVTSIWIGAQAMSGIREDMRGVRGDVARLETTVNELVKRLDEPDESIRFSIPK